MGLSTAQKLAREFQTLRGSLLIELVENARRSNRGDNISADNCVWQMVLINAHLLANGRVVRAGMMGFLEDHTRAIFCDLKLSPHLREAGRVTAANSR